MYVSGLLFMWLRGFVCGLVLAIGLARGERRPDLDEVDPHERVTWPVERWR